MRKRLALIGTVIAATAAVGYAQWGGYSSSDLGKTKVGQSFLHTLSAIKSLYLYPIDEEKLIRGALIGAVSSLDDEFTYYEEPKSNEVSSQDLTGQFFGIGVTLGTNTDGKGGKVDNVFKGGAAAAAGVQVGDIFIKVGDKDVRNSTLGEIVSLVRGKQGTKVTILFSRNGKPFTVTIERQPVNVVSVEKTIIKGNIGYISLNTFYNEKASEQFRAAIAEMKKKGIQKLIVDLRDNGGGLLDAGVDVADQFLNKGPIVSLKQKDGEARVFGTAYDTATDYTGKLVVLVNKNSASASEVVSGALQDNKRALIIGEQTFGKGVAQRPITLPDGGRLAVVNSEWLTPLGRQIHKKGITPDIVVKDTRYPVPLNFIGSGVPAGSKVTLQVGGKPVVVTADKDGKFSYTAPVKRLRRSPVQGEAVLDIPNDAILKKAIAQLNK